MSVLVSNFSTSENSSKANIDLSLCSPYSNFSNKQLDSIENLYDKLDNCGRIFKEFVTPEGIIKNLPVYCNNRSCSNPDCKDHRLYLYMRVHNSQIIALNKSMIKPKGWVFTGWKFDITKLNIEKFRIFIRKKLIFLFNILKEFSVSEYSVHMEIKFYKNTNDIYLHFHVVSAGFRDLRFIRKKWNRHITYEKAIKPKELGYYVSKYASKTPVLNTQYKLVFYHLVVYKTQMHRFSIKQGEILKSGWILLDILRFEIKSAYYRDSYKNPISRKKEYFEFLEKGPLMFKTMQTQLFGFKPIKQCLDISTKFGNPSYDSWCKSKDFVNRKNSYDYDKIDWMVRLEGEIDLRKSIVKKSKQMNIDFLSRLKEDVKTKAKNKAINRPLGVGFGCK